MQWPLCHEVHFGPPDNSRLLVPKYYCNWAIAGSCTLRITFLKLCWSLSVVSLQLPRDYLCCLCGCICMSATHLPNTSSLTPQNCLYLVDAVTFDGRNTTYLFDRGAPLLLLRYHAVVLRWDCCEVQNGQNLERFVRSAFLVTAHTHVSMRQLSLCTPLYQVIARILVKQRFEIHDLHGIVMFKMRLILWLCQAQERLQQQHVYSRNGSQHSSGLGISYASFWTFQLHFTWNDAASVGLQIEKTMAKPTLSALNNAIFWAVAQVKPLVHPGPQTNATTEAIKSKQPDSETGRIKCNNGSVSISTWSNHPKQRGKVLASIISMETCGTRCLSHARMPVICRRQPASCQKVLWPKYSLSILIYKSRLDGFCMTQPVQLAQVHQKRIRKTWSICCTVHQKSTAMLHTAFFRCASVDGLCLPLSTCGSTAEEGSVDPRAGSVGPAGPSHSRGQMWQQLLGDVFHALAQSPSLPWAPLGPRRRVIANGAQPCMVLLLLVTPGPWLLLLLESHQESTVLYSTQIYKSCLCIHFWDWSELQPYAFVTYIHPFVQVLVMLMARICQEPWPWIPR